MYNLKFTKKRLGKHWILHVICTFIMRDMREAARNYQGITKMVRKRAKNEQF